MTSKVEVLIVGAGPTGLLMAVQLVRCGVSVRIIEKADTFSPYSKALVIQTRTVEILAQIGALDKFLEHSTKVKLELNMYNQGKHVAELKLPSVDSSQPYTLFLPQSKTQELLAEYLEELGVEVEFNHELTELKRDASGNVTSATVIKSTSQQQEIIEFTYLVGCDGGKSKVRKSMGIEFEGVSTSYILGICDVEAEVNIPTHGGFSIFWHPKGTAGVITAKDFHRLILTLDEPNQEELNEEQFMKEMNEFMAPSQIKPTKVLWLTSFRVSECKTKVNHINNVFLCGDAAHIHSPAGGQGMNTGLQDAYNLAWKLALMIKEIGKSDVLADSYGQERGLVAEQVLKNSGRMLRMMLSKPTLFTQAARTYVIPFLSSLSPFRQRLSDSMAEIDIDYEPNPLLIKPKAGWFGNSSIIGKRLPNLMVTNLDSGLQVSLQDQLTGTYTFDLVLYLTENTIKITQHVKNLFQNFTCGKSPYQIPDKHSTPSPLISVKYVFHTKQVDKQKFTEEIDLDPQIFKLKDVFIDHDDQFLTKVAIKDADQIIIIRPDGHVAHACVIQDLATVHSYFKSFFNIL